MLSDIFFFNILLNIRRMRTGTFTSKQTREIEPLDYSYTDNLLHIVKIE